MSKNDVLNEIDELVRAGKFEQAIALTGTVPFDDLQSSLSLKTSDDRTFAAYGFYIALLLKSQKAEYHYAASELLSMSLNIYPGAYQLAYYHARQAAALAPDEIFYKEFLLFFYNNPEKVISKTEAQIIAQEILAIDPQNEIAGKIMSGK